MPGKNKRKELLSSWKEFLGFEIQRENPSVYSFAKYHGDLSREGSIAPDYRSARLNTVFFDFDHENLKVAWQETKRLRKYLLEQGAYPRTYYTGNRGFHLYLDFPEITLSYPKETLKAFMVKLKKKNRKE